MATNHFSNHRCCHMVAKNNDDFIDHSSNHPRNTTIYRYILAERDPFVLPSLDTKDWRSAPPSAFLYRPLISSQVILAKHDSAPQLKISEDYLSVTGYKGYSTTRATHYVYEGRWYFEVNILNMPEDAAARIGWGQHYTDLQAPVGCDKFGYCWRSKKGTRFHAGHGKTYGQGYRNGDVLGFFIELPKQNGQKQPSESYKNMEVKQWRRKAEEKLRILPGSTIEYFKNGYSEGVAFTEIYAGCYYPCISLFHEAQVQVNFRPDFKYASILEDYEARGYHERAQELTVEQYLDNLLDFIETSEKVSISDIMKNK